eukprot:g4503.t1
MSGFRPSKFALQPREFLRAGASSMVLLLGIFFAFQAVAAAFSSAGNYYFKAKYLDDWKHLRRAESCLGCVTKKMPLFNRVINMVVLVLVAYTFFIYQVIGVCMDAEDQFGDKVFLDNARLMATANLLLFCGICVFGTLFRRFVKVEVAFLNPSPTPTEADVEADHEMFTIRHCLLHCCRCKKFVADFFTYCGP